MRAMFAAAKLLSPSIVFIGEWEESGGVGRSLEELGGVGRSWEESGGVGKIWEELGRIRRRKKSKEEEELGGVKKL